MSNTITVEKTGPCPCCGSSSSSRGSSVSSYDSSIGAGTCYFLYRSYYDCGSASFGAVAFVSQSCGNIYGLPLNTWTKVLDLGLICEYQIVLQGGPCSQNSDCDSHPSDPDPPVDGSDCSCASSSSSATGSSGSSSSANCDTCPSERGSCPENKTVRISNMNPDYDTNCVNIEGDWSVPYDVASNTWLLKIGTCSPISESPHITIFCLTGEGEKKWRIQLNAPGGGGCGSANEFTVVSCDDCPPSGVYTETGGTGNGSCGEPTDGWWHGATVEIL